MGLQSVKNTTKKEFYGERDIRPQLNGWAPGHYTRLCPDCGHQFTGDKRATACAACAYSQAEASTRSWPSPKSKASISPLLLSELQNYISKRQAPGFFLTKVLENDLVSSVKHADAENIETLPAIVDYLFFQAPNMCWGSPKKVREWLHD